MRFLQAIAAICVAAASGTQAATRTPRGVFAHFMVGNTGNFTTQDWATNMNKAASVGIQAFALNMAADWPYNSQSLEYAFAAAHTTGFKLFFSFDYPGGAYPWDQNVVINYLNKWGGDSNYWQHAPGKPLASTFEGPGNAADWHNIKAKTGCFFMPDWSSVGAFPAIGLAEGVADGLFSWAAWPYGKRKTDTYSDHSYIQALGGSDPSKGSTKPYMMPVSPWFFTNMPGFNKNWMWRGGNLWYERWQQVFELQPEYVQIISWNDFGESHYIGPLDDKQYEAFAIGRGDSPFNYVRDFDHTGWLTHLPFMIQRYLKGTAQFTKESAVVAHQVTLTSSCSGGGTTGNTASQLQLEFAPKEISPDSLYVAALLTAPASFSVSAPGKASYVSVADNKWDIIPDGGIGMYYKSVPMAGAGEHTITLRRGGSVLNEFKTTVQSTCYAGNMANWNARVTSSQWTNGFAAKTWSPTLTRAQQSCIQGWGEGNFNVICDYTCKNGYCPDSCVCENMGIPKPQKRADVTGPGYPKNGDANYAGLCDFACNRGFCPEGACSKTPVAQYIPKVSPFTPDTCVAGTTSGDFKSLCDFGCKYGYCPRNTCACSATGPLNLPPDVNDLAIKPRMFLGLNDDGLCNFGCSRGKDGRNVQCPLVCSNRFTTPAAEDPWDFSWVKSYAALGDSFAAGIGAGERRGSAFDQEWQCSRYSDAYPLKIQDVVEADNFKFLACTGAVIDNIVQDQVPQLNQNAGLWDLITVSAGGNDVGFGDVLKACLFLPNGLSNKAACQKALADAESKIDTVLTPSVNKLLGLLEGKLNYKGVIVWTLYAPFFNLSPEPCNSQGWCFVASAWCMSPDVALRTEFNRLVTKTNDKLIEALGNWKTNNRFRKLQWADWGGITEMANGQFCEPDGAANVADDSNSKLAFIRFNLDENAPHDDLRRREIGGYDEWNNETMVMEYKRQTSWVVPDRILRNFHPNSLGTAYQASVALGMISEAYRIAWDQQLPDVDLSSCPLELPTTTKPVEPPVSTPAPAYQAGTCGIHLDEFDSCEPEDRDLTCEALLVDNAKTTIGQGGSQVTQSCNDGDPFVFNSKLPMPVVITGEHKGDYVQFTYGTFSWASNDETRCSQGGWDPRGSGDTCGIFGDKSRRIRRIDCTFPC